MGGDEKKEIRSDCGERVPSDGNRGKDGVDPSRRAFITATGAVIGLGMLSRFSLASEPWSPGNADETSAPHECDYDILRKADCSTQKELCPECYKQGTDKKE